MTQSPALPVAEPIASTRRGSQDELGRTCDVAFSLKENFAEGGSLHERLPQSGEALHSARDYRGPARDASHSVARSIASCSQLGGTESYLHTVAEKFLQKISCKESMQWLRLRHLRLGGSMWHSKLPTTPASQPHLVLRPVPAAAGTYVSPNGPQRANIKLALRPHRTLSCSTRAPGSTVSHVFVIANMLTLWLQICRTSGLGGTRMGLDHESLDSWELGILGFSY